MIKNENNCTEIIENNNESPVLISLGREHKIDISWLPLEKREILLAEYTRGMMDVSKKAQELHVEASILKDTLDNLATITHDISSTGDSVTITHSQKSSVGRTEVIMGNTDQALTGKLSRSQKGYGDWTPIYLIIAIVGLVLVELFGA